MDQSLYPFSCISEIGNQKGVEQSPIHAFPRHSLPPYHSTPYCEFALPSSGCAPPSALLFLDTHTYSSPGMLNNSNSLCFCRFLINRLEFQCEILCLYALYVTILFPLYT